MGDARRADIAGKSCHRRQGLPGDRAKGGDAAVVSCAAFVYLFIYPPIVTGFDETPPIAIWTSPRFMLSLKINAIATIIMVISITMSVVAQIWMPRRVPGEPGTRGRTVVV